MNAATVQLLHQREQHNDAYRDRMRQRCADAALARELAAEEARRGAQAAIPRRTEIELAPGARLVVGSKIACFTFGPLNIRMARVDQKSIGEALLRLQTLTRQWPDGTMRGIKRLIWKDGAWVSPSQLTVWKEGMCSAKDFDEQGELRGKAGIHAVWPDKLKELNEYSGRLVEIAGWGQCTVGDLGWRAQHAKVVRELL